MDGIQADALRYFRGNLDVCHGIFSRMGGISPAPFAGLNVGGTVGDDTVNVRRNHTLMYAALGVDGARAVTTWLVHSADVVAVDAPVTDRSWVARADGMITRQKGLPLVMRFADCTPILYHDPVQQVIGIAHAGWRGTVAGIASAVICAMQQTYGTHPGDVRVLIGPCISQAHFQVGDEVVRAVEARFGRDPDIVRRDPDDGTAYVDLWEANRRELEQADVTQIEIMRLCTYERTDLFYSHRAEKGNTGRFGAVICL